MQYEAEDSTKRPSTSSSSVDAKFTLNPEDKFLALKPPKSVLKVPRHARSTPTMGGCRSGSAVNDISHSSKNPSNASPSKVTFDLPAAPIKPGQGALYGRKASPVSAPIPRRPSLWNLFHRDSRSADETKLETHQAWQTNEYFNKLSTLRLSSGAGRGAISDTCDTSNAQGRLHEPPLTSNLSPTDRPQSRMGSGTPPLKSPQRHASEFCMLAEPRGLVQTADSFNKGQPEPEHFTLNLRSQLNRLAILPIGYTGNAVLLNEKERLGGSPYNSASAKSQSPAPQNSLPVEAAPVQSPSFVILDSEVQEPFQTTDTDSSYASSYGFSPTWSSTAFTESFSPCQGAQAASPTISDFGDCLTEFAGATSFSANLFASLRVPTAKHASDRFDHAETGESTVYQLPEADESVLTLRDLAKAEDRSGVPKPFDAKNGNDLVEAWNDGAQGAKTTFEEFFDDHSYLSTVIM